MRIYIIFTFTLFVIGLATNFDYEFNDQNQCVNIELSDDYPKTLVSLNGKYDGYLNIKFFVNNNNQEIKVSISKGKIFRYFNELWNSNLRYIHSNSSISYSEKIPIQIFRSELGSIDGNFYFIICTNPAINTLIFGELEYKYDLYNIDNLWVRYQAIFITVIVIISIALLVLFINYLDKKYDLCNTQCRNCWNKTGKCFHECMECLNYIRL